MRFIILPPVTMLLTAATMLVLHRYAPVQRFWTIDLLGWALVGSGLLTAAWHARLFRRIGTNIQTFGEPTMLTRSGLFAYTRNPMYVGFVSALLGLAIALGTLTPFAGVLVYAALVKWWYVPFEERAMRRKFGDAYTAYCLEVRRWL